MATPPQPTPIPVLPYQSPDHEGWLRNPGWGIAALAMAGVYVALTVAAMLFITATTWPERERPTLFLPFILTTFPLGIVALGLGFLGHWSRTGRRWASLAMSISGYTPGAAAMLYAAGEMVQSRLTTELLFLVFLTVLANVVVVWPIGRVLDRRLNRDEPIPDSAGG